jgi:TRAP-type mannitol/chloroaromatic compound transport system permease large subunit
VAKIVSATMPLVFVTMIVLGITLSSVTSSAYAQTNGTSVNQTGKTVTASTPSKQASQSIRGAITSSGQFLENATHKIAGSKSAQTIVNESSDLLGNATVEAKKFFSSK